jgi:hypothetical protein
VPLGCSGRWVVTGWALKGLRCWGASRSGAQAFAFGRLRRTPRAFGARGCARPAPGYRVDLREPAQDCAFGVDGSLRSMGGYRVGRRDPPWTARSASMVRPARLAGYRVGHLHGLRYCPPRTWSRLDASATASRVIPIITRLSTAFCKRAARCYCRPSHSAPTFERQPEAPAFNANPDHSSRSPCDNERHAVPPS